MNIQRIVLRIAMVGVLLAGAGIFTHPVKASGCVRGAFCITNTNSRGTCGGLNNCTCFGKDGSSNSDTVDCSFQ